MNTAPSYQLYVSALRRLMPWLLIISIVAALIAYGLLVRAGVTYTVHFSYLISLSEREQNADYTFDGYYALQATDLFATTVARWLSAPEIVAAAHEAAGLPVTSQVRQLTRKVRAEKTAPQLVQVTVTGSSVDQVTRLTQGLQQEMIRNVAQYHDQGIPALTFKLVPTKQWLGQEPVATEAVVAGVFLLVLILGINGVLLRESFRLN